MLTAFGNNLLEIALDAAPWLLLGLVVAGLIKAFIPEDLLQKWLGGYGFKPVLRGALIGAPLPLCSCGAIPMGLALHRGGASRGATTAFMVGTPGVGVDSLALTYALLGPFMAIVRPLGAIFSAVVAGLLINLLPVAAAVSRAGNHLDPTVATSIPPNPPSANGCGPACSCPEEPTGRIADLKAGLRYTFSEVLDDIAWWLLLGLVLAAGLLTAAPPGVLGQYAVGPVAMLVVALIGIPMYLCAQAVTPVAAALIVAGVSPGTALVLLLAGPITSIATLAVLRREFGLAATAVYVVAVAGVAIVAGLLTDTMITAFSLDIPAQLGAARQLLPEIVKYPALAVLLFMAVKPLRTLVLN
ncbi:MAG: SO_0444 family Cu/Zn efflux transporter [Desulfurivibrio sp.]|nr:SO_0444 family Cu/Zn efflux transporter [Desulfurivibrio sp.]